jgi:hypothetical protein
LYYPTKPVNENRHTIVAIEKMDKILVPFRNPKDSIASWHNYPSEGSLESDVRFYIRFYSFVSNNLSKIVLMDFNNFTNDIDYIKDKVLKNFAIQTNCYVTDAQVKEKMLTNAKEINLPTQNQTQLLETKTLLLKVLGFQECILIYDKLQQAAI